MIEYKIWGQIEAVDEEKDEFEDWGEPRCIGVYSTFEEANARVQSLEDFFYTPIPDPPSFATHRDYRPPLSQGGTALGHCKKCMTLIKFGQEYCEECKQQTIRIDDDIQQEK